MQFKKLNEDEVDIIKYCEIQYSLGNEIYIGTDSQKHGGIIKFATVVAFRNGRKGVHFVYYKWRESYPPGKMGQDLINYRIRKEINATLNLANYLNSNGIKIVQMDFDVNGEKNTKSSKFINEVNSYNNIYYQVKACAKPDELVACAAANELVK